MAKRTERQGKEQRGGRVHAVVDEVRAGGTARPDEVERAVTAVLCALEQRISGRASTTLARDLSADTRALLTRCELHRAGGAHLEGAAEFVALVGEHLQVPRDLAEHTVDVVFAGIRRQIPDDDVVRIARELPEDLRGRWRPGPLPAETAPAPPRADAYGAFLEEVATRGNDAARPEAAAQAVVCVLAQRLSGGEALRLLGLLPAKLRALVGSCGRHAADAAERFDRAEFLRRVGAHLDGLDPDAAGPLVRAVFAGLRRFLTPTEAEGVAAQLPHDLQSLWREPPSLAAPT